MTIQAVIFDLDGTLRVSRPRWEEIFIREAKALGVEPSPEAEKAMQRWAHYFWADSDELHRLLRVYGESDAFWVGYNRERLLRLGCTQACADELAEPLFHRLNHLQDTVEDIVPEDVPPTLAKLKAAGYCLGILTNRRFPLNGYLEEIGLASYMDFVLVAGEIGVWKPAPEAFLKAAEAAKVLPHQAAYVGDNYYADIVGARRAGLFPVLLDPLGLFPEAEVPTIRRVGDLPRLLEAS